MDKILTTGPDDLHWTLLSPKFFARSAPSVASDLLTCLLLRKTANSWIGGPICETEAYTEDDEASHTFGGRNARNASMYDAPGTLYVYRSYGIHWCLNLSTGDKGRGEAVLIRALSPTYGINQMIPGASKSPHKLCSGPGRLCAALGIDKAFDGQMMGKGELGIWQATVKADFQHAVGERIGISKAVDKTWRFGIQGHPSLSKPFPPGSEKEKKNKESS